MIEKKWIRIFNEWTWLFGILMGLTIGLGYIGIKQSKANDDVIHYLVRQCHIKDLSRFASEICGIASDYQDV
jgi:hypothetical protein